MRIEHLRLQNFRNIKSCDLGLEGDFHFFHGDNGQGKTNLLEAIYYLSHLRSFRTQDPRSLIRWGEQEMGIGISSRCEIHERTEGVLRVNRSQRQLQLDGESVTRFSDYLGRMPTVILSSHDIQLLRGSPSLRRRFVDMTMASVITEYFRALRDYHKAIKERNALLKSNGSDGELAAFEAILARTGTVIVSCRGDFIDSLGHELKQVYSVFSPAEEKPSLTYKPNFGVTSVEDYQKMLKESRLRDRQFQSTSRGPHRDEFEFSLFSKDARDAGSEGQQRGLVIALRMAQAAIIKGQTGITPVLLADDILTELDTKRKAAFWKTVQKGTQVLATGTIMPEMEEGREWTAWRVDRGAVARA